MNITRVTIDDIKQLQKIGRQTFSETFSSGNSEENMAEYLKTRFSTEKLKTELTNNNSEFYFAEIDKRVIGYLKINFEQSQTEISDQNSLEIERTYVLSERNFTERK